MKATFQIKYFELVLFKKEMQRERQTKIKLKKNKTKDTSNKT